MIQEIEVAESNGGVIIGELPTLCVKIRPDS